MLTVVGIFLLMGAALGLRFNVFVLCFAIGFAFLGTAVLGIGHGNPIGFVVLVMVLIGCALQIGYLAGIAADDVVTSTNADAPQTVGFRGGVHKF
jgi:hypothetical protein